MAGFVWAYKGENYRLVKVGPPAGGYDVIHVGAGWIGWTAGSVSDAKNMVKEMVK